MREVWGWDFGDLSTVTVHVRRLRGKVEDDPARPRLIQTVWGVGYRFDCHALRGGGLTMNDTLLIALFAFLGAVAAGLLGAGVLWLIRRRSLTASLAVVAAVAVTAMLAGTLAVAQAMFLSPHDLTVVTMVVAMAAVVSLATALLLGRWVVASSRALTDAARSFGDGGHFAAPDGPCDRRTRRAQPGVGRYECEAGRVPRS